MDQERLGALFGVSSETAQRALSCASSARHAEWLLLHAHVEGVDVDKAAVSLGAWRSSVVGHYWTLGWRASRWAPPRLRLRSAQAVVWMLRAAYGY